VSFAIIATIHKGWFTSTITVRAETDCILTKRVLQTGWDGNADVQQWQAKIQSGALFDIKVPKKKLPEGAPRLSADFVAPFVNDHSLWQNVAPDQVA
jgi:hypothetical protein